MEATTILIINQAVIFLTLVALIGIVLRLSHRVIEAIEALTRARVSK